MGEDGQGKGQTRLGTLRPGQEREGCYMAEKAEDVQLKSPEGTVRKQKKEQWKKKETEIRRPAGSLQEREAEEQAGPGAGRLTTQTFQRTEGHTGSTVRVCFLRIKDESLFSSASVHMPYVRCCWSGKHVALT